MVDATESQNDPHCSNCWVNSAETGVKVGVGVGVGVGVIINVGIFESKRKVCSMM